MLPPACCRSKLHVMLCHIVYRVVFYHISHLTHHVILYHIVYQIIISFLLYKTLQWFPLFLEWSSSLHMTPSGDMHDLVPKSLFLPYLTSHTSSLSPNLEFLEYYFSFTSKYSLTLLTRPSGPIIDVHSLMFLSLKGLAILCLSVWLLLSVSFVIYMKR